MEIWDEAIIIDRIGAVRGGEAEGKPEKVVRNGIHSKINWFKMNYEKWCICI